MGNASIAAEPKGPTRRCSDAGFLAAIAVCAAACFSMASVGRSLAYEPGGRAGDLAEEIQQFDARVFPDAIDREWLLHMVSADVAKRRVAGNQRETAAWSNIRGREDWERFRDARLQALRQSLGEPPMAPSTPAVTVTGTVRGDGYQIENVVFESRPGLLVTANLYGPVEPRDSMAGVLICHSHHNPKTQGELQAMGIAWAKQGNMVLVMDQLGHGERRQHPFRSADDYAGEFRVGRQDYYFRYTVGMQLHAIGESLIGWMVWDLMRGVDVLLGRPGIDPARIILLGAVAGGGDPAGVAAALDTRIAAAAPFNFGGPQPETEYPLPADAAESFDYGGGGSWESTRNLRLSIRDGFAPWVIVGAIAPRRLIYAHEFAWDQPRDPVWMRLEAIFGLYGVSEHLAETHGAGSVRGEGAGNTHCSNVGPEHLAGIHAALARWFCMPVPPQEESPRHSVEELTCLTPVAAADRPMRLVHTLARELGAQRAAMARERLSKLSPAERRARLRADWRRLLGDIEPQHEPKLSSAAATSRLPIENESLSQATVERIALEVEPGIVVPLVLLTPSAKRSDRYPVVVAVAQQGKQTFLERRADAIAELLSDGIAVCLPDLRGVGEAEPDDGRGRNSAATSLSSSELMLGQTTVGLRLRDLRSVLRYLRERPEVDAQRIAVWGDSFARTNPRDQDLAAPLDAAEPPELAEPLGGLLVLLAALFDDEIKAVAASGGLVSFESLLDSPFVYVPHDILVPGAMTAGDLCDVAAALSPRPLLLADLVDGRNRPVSAGEAALVLLPTAEAYAGASDRLSLPGAQPPSIASWMQRVLTD